jgi:tetratricopeptide (TPR) repeat protein
MSIFAISVLRVRGIAHNGPDLYASLMRAVAFLSVVAGLGVARAQPPPEPEPEPAPTESAPAAQETPIQRATALYAQATAAMEAGRFGQAARDFIAAYDITKDPVLFFKIGSAHEKLGDCATALLYYRRYLAEANPEPQFVELTNERVAECAVDEPAASATPTPETTRPALVTSRNKDGAWLFVGGALTFLTAGAVLAYSIGSSEQDLRDLYTSTTGRTPVFDDKTRERYDALIAEGKRFEVLAWTSFGLAAGCAIGAAIYFRRAAREGSVTVTPVVTPTSAGVSVRF